MFLALCSIYLYCSTKKSRKEAENRHFQENLTKYIDGVHQSGNYVDLDTVPDADEQSLPMLKDANISSPLAASNVTGSEASSIVDEERQASEQVSKQ